MSDRWATFDCYGTLIDWDGGIRRELARIFGEELADGLLARYHEVEPEIQAAGPELSYREVMARSLERLDAPEAERGALGSSLPSWEPFPEVPDALEEAKGRGWKLAILSNTDRDFIGASKARLGIPFDETIVASEIGSYKPGHRHWSEFFARTHADRGRHVHVAASHFHDIVPACELGLRSIWINRLGETGDPSPTSELADLNGLADALDDLVGP
jgi:2-haloacid dehalogenase